MIRGAILPSSPIRLILAIVTLASLSKNTVIPVVDGKYVLSIEPYIAEWCAAQFGTLPSAEGLFEATNGVNLQKMISKRSYKLVEPYFGGYCFDIYGYDQLKDLNRDDTLYELSKRGKHVEIEPYLMEWGEVASKSNQVPDVENYVSNWCVEGQFRDYMPDKARAFEMAGRHIGEIEAAMAPWCWKQFPNEMKDLDQDFYVKSMGTRRVKIEPYLMKWEITNYHVRKHPLLKESSASGGSSFGGFLLRSMLVIVVVIVAFGYVQKNHPQVTEEARDKVQQVITVVGSSVVGSSLQQPRTQPDFQYSSMPMTATGSGARSDDVRLSQSLM